MKVGICVTTHRSQNIRPQGKELLDIFCLRVEYS